MFFSIFASLLAFTVPLMIIGAFRPENERWVLLTGLLFGLDSAAAPPRLRESWKSVMTNRPFRLGLGIYVFTLIAVDLVQAIILYFP